MKSMRFFQPHDDKTEKKPPKLKTFRDTFILPPLVPKPKIQGPFRTQKEVWKQRNRPLSPSLRVSTEYDSKEIARYAHIILKCSIRAHLACFILCTSVVNTPPYPFFPSISAGLS